MARGKAVGTQKSKRNRKPWKKKKSTRGSVRCAPVPKKRKKGDVDKPSKVLYPLGGYIINPPKTCPKRVRCDRGGIWVDSVRCLKCENNGICDHYKMYSAMNHEQRKNYMESQGVYFAFPASGAI